MQEKSQNIIEFSGEILSRNDAARYLGICKGTLDKAKLPIIRIGRRVLFRKTALDTWLEQHECNSGATDDKV